MHPVPPLADLEWLRGDRLDVVSTAEFTMWFVFDSKGAIQADELVELFGTDGSVERYNPQTREGSWSFYKIVGARVKDVVRPDDWTIAINFESNLRLVTRSSDGGYESGRVTMPERDAQTNGIF